MRDGERLSALIGNVYDAALDASLWVEALRDIAEFVGGAAAALASKDATSKTGTASFQFGLDPRYVELYFDKYIKLDPATTAQFFADIGEPVATADLVPYEEFLQTRFYKEWARPQHLVDCMSSVFDKSATSAAMAFVFRHARDGLIDAEARRRMRLIMPHVRRSGLIGKVLELRTAEAATLADTVEGISAGMLMVDAAGRIVHANRAGHAMLEQADLVRSASGRLAANEAGIGQTLLDLFAGAAAGDAAVGIKGVALPLTARNGERYVAHVLPLTCGARRRAGARYRATAALFVHKAALCEPAPPEAIAKAYRLTPTELRVLLAVVEVGGVPEVAETLGIAETTVRTHLGRLYDKTGASRQADLVKVVAAFANPLTW